MRRSFDAHRAALSVGLALLLGACGGGTDDTDDAVSAASSDEVATSVAAPGGDASGSSAIDVCAMLTDEQVEAATGVAVTNKEPGGGQGFATGACGWELDSGTSIPGIADFTVSVKSPGGRAQFEVLAGQMQPVPDVGDEAFQQGDSIWSITGDSLVIVDYALLASDVADPFQAVLPLVEIILSQL